MIQQYQQSGRLVTETKDILEFWGGENWREDKGEEMQRCILVIVKEEWKILKPSILRYHQELRMG